MSADDPKHPWVTERDLELMTVEDVRRERAAWRSRMLELYALLDERRARRLEDCIKRVERPS